MIAPLLKIAVLAASVLWGWLGGKRVTNGRTDEDPPAFEDKASDFSRTLDLAFSIAFFSGICMLLGVFHVKPLESRGYDAYGELVMMLVALALKGLFLVLLPALLLTRMLSAFKGLGFRLVAYGIFASLCAAGWMVAKQRDAVQARASANAASERRAEAERVQREAASMEEARAIAARKESEEHEHAVKTLVELTFQVHSRWQEDLHTASAIGFEGDIPPMLSVIDDGIYEKKITNLRTKKACVQLVRVLRQEGGSYERCPSDAAAACTTLARGESMLFSVRPGGANEACRRGLIEYRVGTPLAPEPSWWSVSALGDSFSTAADYHKKYSAMTTIDLVNERARLENILDDTFRAERWKRELR